ncbi:MAG: bifunctional precorrin-2 dehydrogenase/sirohydrochlorin ferrochelatase [Acidobacteriota bacterium]
MFLPLFFKSEGLACLVIGGGEVAARKIEMLLGIGCAVTVISPEVVAPVRRLADSGGVQWLAREYQSGDCRDRQLVVAATQHREVNRAVFLEALSLGVPVNVVDDPELCTVIFPALWRDGALTVAVSTGGTAPFMAAAVRDRLAAAARPMGEWVEAAGRFRAAVREGTTDDRARNRLYREFLRAMAGADAAGTPDTADLAEWLAWLDTVDKKGTTT